MTEEEKNDVALKRIENPPLCKCGDPAVVDSNAVVPEFVCRNKCEVSKLTYPLNHCFAVFEFTMNLIV